MINPAQKRAEKNRTKQKASKLKAVVGHQATIRQKVVELQRILKAMSKHAHQVAYDKLSIPDTGAHLTELVEGLAAAHQAAKFAHGAFMKRLDLSYPVGDVGGDPKRLQANKGTVLPAQGHGGDKYSTNRWKRHP